MVLINPSKVKLIVHAVTIILIIFFSFYLVQSYESNRALAARQLRINTLKERIRYLDEGLTMSARLYVLESDVKWKNRYDEFVPEYALSIKEINKILPQTYNGKEEMALASDQLLALEAKAFKHISLNNFKESKDILFGPFYLQQSKNHQSGLVKLTAEIEQLGNELYATYKEKIIIQSLLALLMLLCVVTSWILYNFISNQWHLKNNKIAIEKAETANAAEEKLQVLNGELRLLSLHLQEVREKDKQRIAYEISEDVCQQLMAFNVKFQASQHLLNKEALHSNLLQEANDQLNSALLHLNNLALDVYPGILKDLGLIDALNWEFERLGDEKNISIILFTEEDELYLKDSVAIKVFRITQDKLRSLIYNKASDIIVSLSVENQNLILSFNHNATLDMALQGNVLEQLIMEEYLRSIDGKTTTNISKEGDLNFTISIPLTQYESVPDKVEHSLSSSIKTLYQKNIYSILMVALLFG